MWNNVRSLKDAFKDHLIFPLVISVIYVCKCFPTFFVLSTGKQIKICEVIDDAHLGSDFFCYFYVK